MKRHHFLSVFPLCVSFAAACQPSTYAPPRTGIEFELSSAGRAGLQPDGVFRVEGLDRRVSTHVPATPLDPSERRQRIDLPPGTYSVAYVPVELHGSLTSIRARDDAKVISQNPFRVVVSDGSYTTVRVRAVDGADAKLGARRANDSALVR